MGISLQKKALLFLVATVFLIGSVALGYNLIVKNNPKKLYLLAEYKTIQQTLKDLERNHSEDWDLHNKLVSQPSTTISEITGDFNVEGSTLQQGLEILLFKSILSKSKITINVDQDPVQNKNLTSLDLSLSGSRLISTDLYHSVDHFGIQVPMLYNKYFYIENDQFGEIMRKFNPSYYGPEELRLTNNLDRFTVSAERIDRINKEYPSFILEHLKEEYITLTKDVSYQSPEGLLPLRQIEVSLSENEVKEVLHAFIDKLNEDDETLRMISDQVDHLTFPDGFYMSVFLNKQGLIIDRTIRFSTVNEENEGVTVDLSLKKWLDKNEDKTSSWLFEIRSTNEPSTRLVLKTKLLSTKDSLGLKENFTGSFAYVEGQSTHFEVALDLNTTTKLEKEKKHSEYDFTLDVRGTGIDENIPSIGGKITRVAEHQLKKNISSQEWDVLLHLGMDNPSDGKQVVSAMMNLKTDIQFKDNVDIVQFNKENSVNVAELHASEWMVIQANIEQAVQEFILRNSKYVWFLRGD